MAPTLVFDANGLELAIGAAGATRLRTALATVLAAILDEGLDAEAAVGLPRVHPISELVDAEPGVDEARAHGRSRSADERSVAGIGSTTTSAASAASAAPAQRVTLVGAATRSSSLLQ